MASREARRQKRSAQKEDKNQVERRREKNPVLYIGSVILFVIITVAFVGSGFFGASSGGGQGSIVFGQYAGKNVEFMFDNYFGYRQRQINDQLSQSNQTSDPNLQTRQIWESAFNDTVKHLAVLLKAEQSGYYTSEEAVNRAVLVHYRDQFGNFSEKLYNEKGKRERDLIRILYRENLLEQLYLNDILDSHLYSKNEANFYKNMMKKEKAFRFVEFSNSEYPDEKVKEYGKANVKDFKTINLSRIFLANSNKATADSLISQYNSGEKSFENLAKDWSGEIFADKGGDMGTQYYYEVKNFFESEEQGEQVADELFSFEEGTVNVYQDGENWIIYKVNSTAKEPDMEDEEILTGIREYINTYKRGEVEDYAAELAKNFVQEARANGFNEAAAAIGKSPVDETEYFPINYTKVFYSRPIKVKGDDSTKLSAASASEEFFESAFSLSNDEISEPINLDEKVVVLQQIGEQDMSEEDWEQVNSTYKSFLGYQSPGLLEKAEANDNSYLYQYTVLSYIREDHDSVIVDNDKLKNNFSATYAKNISRQ